MSNLKPFAGFDVSKTFFDVCIRCQGQERILRYNYDEKGLLAMVKQLPQDAHCIMEATGPYYLKLARFLYTRDFLVSVVNPLVIKRFSQMRLLRTKTDKADARMIAAYGLAEQPAPWTPESEQTMKLRQMEALLHQLEKQRSALMCQQEAFTATGMFDKEVRRLLKAAVCSVERRISIIEQRMYAIVKEWHAEELTNLVSIPGIGKKTAIMLLVLTDCFKKFENHKQLSAYIGMCPRIFESGSSVKGKARICKMGMSRIRALLYLCAWSAKRCNSACKALYERLIAKGKSKRLALIAVAHKLIKQAFAITTNNCAYQDDYKKIICF